MKIRIGYVAISKTMNITTSKTITYKEFQKLDENERNKKINNIILENFKNLEEILIYNVRNNIFFYRMTSKLIPLATHPLVEYDIFNKYKKQFEKIGKIVKKFNIRLDTHPDQFCVLNSTKQEVIDSSINILKFHQNMFKAMKLDSKIILHVGSSVFGKKPSLTRFKNNFKKLDSSLQKMIIIENDDKVFTMKDVLKLCQNLNIPMVLDVHHHNCNNDGEEIKDYIKEIFETWNNNIPKIHFSSPKNCREKRNHHDYINVDDFISFINEIKFVKKDFDIMIEAKAKDEALFSLIRLLKYKNIYKIEKNIIFL